MIESVFVPALMAVGVLVSAAIAIADWLSGMFPSRMVWRRQQVTRDALGTVSRIALAGGADASPVDLRRRITRARRVYLIAAVVLAGLGALVVRFGEDLYGEPIEWLHGSPWTLAIGYGLGGVLVVIAVVSLIPAFISLQSGRVVRALVEHTWLGKPAAPPEDPRELVTSERNGQ